MKNPNNFIVASKGTRFANYLIDIVMVYPFAFVIGILIGIFDPYFFDYMTEAEETLLGFCIFFVYYLFFEGVFEKTIGKMITKTKVISINGDAPKFSDIIGRTLSRCIPFEAFSFLGESGIGWHDSISKTLVVSANFNKETEDKVVDTEDKVVDINF